MRIRLHAPWHGGWGRLTRTARRAVGEFFADNCTKLAAAISFHVLFALFPLAILLVALGGVLLRDEDVKDDVLGSLFDVLPLSGEGQERLEELLDSVAEARNALGLIAVLGLLWTASGLMAAVRTALNLAWDVRARRPPLQGKLVDILLVGFVGILVMLSVALTATLEVAGAIGERLGPFGEGASALVSVAGFLAPVLVLFVAALTVYKFVPASRPPFRDIWLGAAFAAVAVEAAKRGFAFYLENFGDYNAVYGSLGAVIAFLAFVYLAANLFLLGAELAAEWPRAVEPD